MPPTSKSFTDCLFANAKLIGFYAEDEQKLFISLVVHVIVVMMVHLLIIINHHHRDNKTQGGLNYEYTLTDGYIDFF